jgi:hypothetical protein
VAESFGDDLDRDAGGDEQRCVGVAQVVESDAGEVVFADLPAEELGD